MGVSADVVHKGNNQNDEKFRKRGDIRVQREGYKEGFPMQLLLRLWRLDMRGTHENMRNR